MGQLAHRRYKEFKNAQEKLKSYSSEEDKLEVRIKELKYQLQKREDEEEDRRANELFDRMNGRD